MNVMDSSGWLEYFADGPNAQFFAPAIEDLENLLVPTISIYEVFKRVLQQRGKAMAMEATAIMMQGQVVELDASIAIHGAQLSDELKIPMADNLMLATARNFEAILWTQDSDFEKIPNVKYVAKR